MYLYYLMPFFKVIVTSQQCSAILGVPPRSQTFCQGFRDSKKFEKHCIREYAKTLYWKEKSGIPFKT